MQRGAKRTLSPFLAAAAIFAAAGWWASHHDGHVTDTRAASQASAATSRQTSAQVSDPTAGDQERLEAALDGIPGLQEVALSSTGGGLAVTATIEVPSNVEPSSHSVVTDSLMQEYLSDVFSADPSITYAELYFVSGGELVAGGALSRAAFTNWAVGTVQQSSDTALLQWMQTLQPSGDNPSKYGWFETQ
ncbi:MAG: hypothetical protein K6T78_07315 [Alicyclobacillus sp.]|nr:hypothetical protein [Alicyclobacillus sp.]